MPIRLPLKTTQNWLKDCLEEQTFVCIDGQRARSVKDMVRLLEKISQEHYNYHVNKEKNDFANWAQGVFHNGHLTASFKSARSKKEAYQYCKRHYLMLQRNIRDENMRQERKRERSLEKQA